MGRGAVKTARKRVATAKPERAGKGTRNPERTMASILAAATKEFTEKGFGGARVNDIADRASINKRMLYHYFGDKEELYLAVLEEAYVGIRSAEAGLHLADRDPEEAMRHLTSFTWRYFLDHPEFLSLLNTENLLRGKFIRTSKRIIALHSPMIGLIDDTLKRGAASGEFRPNVDPVELYISIASLGFFYLSNRWTLSTIFRRDLGSKEEIERRGEHIVEVVMAYLRPSA
jgi:AcrR family transcriptional regulator